MNDPFRNNVSEEEVAGRISDIRDLISKGSEDSVTDYLYQNTDNDFNDGKFRIWQHVMEQMSVEELGTSWCRSLLVLTQSVVFYFPDDDFKKTRNVFFDKVFKFAIEVRGEEKAKRLFGILR